MKTELFCLVFLDKRHIISKGCKIFNNIYNKKGLHRYLPPYITTILNVNKINIDDMTNEMLGMYLCEAPYTLWRYVEDGEIAEEGGKPRRLLKTQIYNTSKETWEDADVSSDIEHDSIKITLSNVGILIKDTSASVLDDLQI